MTNLYEKGIIILVVIYTYLLVSITKFLLTYMYGMLPMFFKIPLLILAGTCVFLLISLVYVITVE